MDDPVPENISGEKRVLHSVEHQINWGYVMIAVAVIFVVWKLTGAVEEDNDDLHSVGE